MQTLHYLTLYVFSLLSLPIYVLIHAGMNLNTNVQTVQGWFPAVVINLAFGILTGSIIIITALFKFGYLIL
jgi:hypothetical protein